MTTIAPDPVSTAEPTLSEVRRFYDRVLRNRLEPEHADEFVAIDVAHEEYAVSPDALQAFKALEAKGLEPPFVLLRVGREAVWEGLSE